MKQITVAEVRGTSSHILPVTGKFQVLTKRFKELAQTNVKAVEEDKNKWIYMSNTILCE